MASHASGCALGAALILCLSIACGGTDSDSGGGRPAGTGGKSTGGASSGGTSAGGSGGTTSGGSGGTTSGGSGGASSGGSAGSATGGSAGSATGGSAGTATGGSGGTATGGSGGTTTGGSGGAATGGTGGQQTMVTVWMSKISTSSFRAVDNAEKPLLIDAAASFDHDGDGKKDVFAAVGSTRYRYLGKTTAGGDLRLYFGEPAAFKDAAGQALAPDILVDGVLTGTSAQLIGVFGAEARIYDFKSASFGSPIALKDAGGAAFTPLSLASASYNGSAPKLLAAKVGSTELYEYSGGAFKVVVTIKKCKDSWLMQPKVVVPGKQFAAGVILLDGNGFAYSDAGACFDEIPPMMFSQPLFGVTFDVIGLGENTISFFQHASG